MKKAPWILLALVFLALGFWSAKLIFKKSETSDRTITQPVRGSTYWTCPMHPQIHSDKPGECPICHMKLVEVKALGAHSGHLEEAEPRAMVQASPPQMQHLNVQRVAAERMDLTARIPISGRLLTPSTVAFQVFESDLRYIKPGITFHGESSLSPDMKIFGTVRSVDTIVDPTSRTVRVIGQIQRGPHGLISETTFSGEVEIVLKSVIAIPESAVLHTGRGDIVYTIHDDGSLMAQTVRLGQKTESYYEIIEGLEPGTAISSGPNFLIDSEAKIRGTSNADGAASGHTHN